MADISKLKANLKQKAPQVTINDDRHHGYRRLYFFLRKQDEYVFPIDNELQAHHLLRRRDFKDKFEYLGWSEGKHFSQLKSFTPVYEQDEEGGAQLQNKDAQEAYAKRYYEVLENELEDAINNTDKTPPRDFRRRDLSGNVITQGPLSGIMDYLK